MPRKCKCDVACPTKGDTCKHFEYSGRREILVTEVSIGGELGLIKIEASFGTLWNMKYGKVQFTSLDRSKEDKDMDTDVGVAIVPDMR
ncbi:hypothetical protein A2U01_0040087 [Trifolium medium]|uniref:Uncharacterized protein n=1 Tax=Trifolium medium TaxID=97028 RepID=A0A392Q4U1_9FABA|nr:hypothetical protein [Trifolium medium]